MPDGKTARNTDIERMLDADLRYLDTEIARIHHLLVHSVDLMTEDKGIFPVGPWVEILKWDAPLDLLETA